MRVMGFMALAVVLGVATGLVLERVIVGVLVGAGVVLLGLFILLAQADSTDAEVLDEALRASELLTHW